MSLANIETIQNEFSGIIYCFNCCSELRSQLNGWNKEYKKRNRAAIMVASNPQALLKISGLKILLKISQSNKGIRFNQWNPNTRGKIAFILKLLALFLIFFLLLLLLLLIIKLHLSLRMCGITFQILFARVTN